MEKKIKSIMASVFNISESKIDENASPDSIDEWDSLSHTNLVMALEQGFDVSFTTDEVIEMLNYKLIKLTISEKLGSV